MAKKILNLVDSVFSTNLLERINKSILCGNHSGGGGGGGGCPTWEQDAYIDTMTSLSSLLSARGKSISFWMDASSYSGNDGDALVSTPVRNGLESNGVYTWHTGGENGVPYLSTSSNNGLRSTIARPRTVVNVIRPLGASSFSLPAGRHALNYNVSGLFSFINLGRPPLSVDYTWEEFSITLSTDYLSGTTLFYDVLSYQNGVSLYNSGSSAYNNPSESGGQAIGDWYESIVINDLLTVEEGLLLKSYLENKYCADFGETWIDTL